jgi:Ca2+-binding EF-hand superfamily protein
MQVFDQLDRDKKGYITKDDLNGFFKTEDKKDTAYEILQKPVCITFSPTCAAVAGG